MAPPLLDLITTRAAAAPQAVLYADARSRRVVTRADLATAASRWTGELDARSVPAGARVLVDVDDPLAFAVVHLAVMAAGRCSAPVDPAAPPAEAARTRLLLDPALIVSDRAPAVIGPAGPAGPAAWLVRAEPGSGLPATDLPGAPACIARSPAGTGSAVLLTSGSTGEPKAVELAVAQQLHVARAVAVHHRLDAADRGYCPLPLFHVNAQVVGLLATLVAGGELMLDRRFRRTRFWELLVERDVTWINAVPAILTILARDPEPIVVGPHLRFARSASAALPGPVRDLFQARTGLPVIESYGMTEAASQITATSLDGPHRAGSVGRPVGVELRITDDAGAGLPAGTVGRVRLRGPGVITAYAGGPAGTAGRIDADGWLDTTDLGHLDADGQLYLAGRADDVVNRGGELVHPREVEEVLLGEPDVAEAVVVARPDPVLGAVPVACVRADGSARPDLAERLAARCARELAIWKRPVEIHVVDAFPRGPTGKVRRSAVREALAGVAG